MLGLSSKRKAKALAEVVDLRAGFIPPADLRSGPTWHAWRHWEKLRAQRAMPAPRDLDPVSIPKLLRHTIIVDVEPEPLDFIYTIVGQEFVETFHVNPKGKTVTEFAKSPAVFARAFLDVYMQVYETKAPMAYREPITASNHSPFRRECVWLPFSSDGRNVERVWCALRFDASEPFA